MSDEEIILVEVINSELDKAIRDYSDAQRMAAMSNT